MSILFYIGIYIVGLLSGVLVVVGCDSLKEREEYKDETLF